MIINYRDKKPNIDNSVYIAYNADVIGDVLLKRDSSVWFHTVIRADNDHIQIGEMSNVQDHCTLHSDYAHVLTIGNRVTIGHNAIVHGACIEDECMIGMGAIILNGAHIGKHSIIGAGALVREHQVIPENSVVVGNPARVIKMISEEQRLHIVENAEHYAALAQEYKMTQGSE